MENQEYKRVVIIGSGNLAQSLCKRLVKRGHEIVQIVGRSKESTETLAQYYFTSYTLDISKIKTNADIYLLCVSDESISEIASKLRLKNQLVLHCSGATPLSILDGVSENYGVMYPLQTFTPGFKVKFKKTPFLVEANNFESLETIKKFVLTIGKNVVELNSRERLNMHLAAVLSSNFTNHLISLTQQFLEQNNTEKFHLLIPLLKQTAKKIKEMPAMEAQTGPALRGDTKTMNKHLELLSNNKDLKDLYQTLSDSIKKLHHGKL